jgi:hypothetical protein
MVQQLRVLGFKEPRNATWPTCPYKYAIFILDLKNNPLHAHNLSNIVKVKLKSFDNSEIPPTLILLSSCSQHNVIVKDDYLVAVPDWETLGWYPDFLEGGSSKGVCLLETVNYKFTTEATELDRHFTRLTLKGIVT